MNFLTADEIKLHLKSLPSTSKEMIAGYFETRGNDVKVISIEMIGADEATVLLSGLTNDGNSLIAYTTVRAHRVLVRGENGPIPCTKSCQGCCFYWLHKTNDSISC